MKNEQHKLYSLDVGNVGGLLMAEITKEQLEDLILEEAQERYYDEKDREAERNKTVEADDGRETEE